MELNCHFNRQFLFIILSIMLHALAALLYINKPISSDIGKISEQNRRVLISAVFKDKSSQEKEEAERVSEVPENIEKTEEIYVSEKDLNITSEIREEYSESIMDYSASADKTTDTNVNSTDLAEAAENSISSIDRDPSPETLSIDSFTTDLSPEYPKFAQKNSYEGIVRVFLTVNRNGKGENIRIMRSSGYSVLDKAALKAVKKATFKAVNSRIYYLAAALNKPLVIDINFSLTQG